MTFSPTTFSPMLADSDPLISLLQILAVIMSFLVSIILLFGSIYLIHFLFSIPMRRQERARLFLELLEDAVNRGQPIEAMILSLAENRDCSLGVRFHLLAAHIENGLRFGEVLKKVPRFLPPQINAMLLAGEKFGDLKKILPACREILHERPAGVRSAIHYMLLVVLFFSPVFVGVVMTISVFVVPRFKDVAAGMGISLWPLTRFVFELNDSSILIYAEILISLAFLLATILYVGGPQFARRIQSRKLPVTDWIAWRLPWKQKRLQRTFSAMLAVLLDGGVPEAEAVRLAGDCTANEICRRRAQRAVAALQAGANLTEAVRAMDDAGEFRWRLANATHAHGGFLSALRGWHEALDAKAFQQEEATAHVVTSGIVILNGVLVALIATAMFGILIAVLNGMLSSM